jgi:hypothetical protein
MYCATPGTGASSANVPVSASDKDDKGLKVIDQVLTSVKENTERAIKAAEASNDTVKWVYTVQSGLAALVGVVLASIGGVLGYLGFRNLKDFRRFQLRARRQREFIRRRFLEESKRMENWGGINAQFTSASTSLAILASIRDEEVREETLRAHTETESDKLVRAQRDSRKQQAFEHVIRSTQKLRDHAEKSGNLQFISWAESAEAAANLSAGNLDAALDLAKKAKLDNPMNHPDRPYRLGFVYARMFYERKDSQLKEAALREFREAFSQDSSGALLRMASRDKELELYLGQDAPTQLAAGLTP